jgi:hypothetical protein
MHRLSHAGAQKRLRVYDADRSQVNSEMVKRNCIFGAAALLGLVGCSELNPRVATTLNQAAAPARDLPSNPLRGEGDFVRHQHAGLNHVHALRQRRYRAVRAYELAAGLSRRLCALPCNVEAAGGRRWFGGRILGAPKSVEFVTVSVGDEHRPSYSYQNFEGAPFKQVSAQEGPTPNERAAYILSQRAAVMP